jgi:hypothetical protein
LSSSRASLAYGIKPEVIFQRACKSSLPNILQSTLDVSSIVLCVFFFFVFSLKIQEHKQVALPISMHKRLFCASLSDWSHIYHRLILKYIISVLTTGSGNAGTCEKLHDRSWIRFRKKKPVCVQAALLRVLHDHRFLHDLYCAQYCCLL